MSIRDLLLSAPVRVSEVCTAYGIADFSSSVELEAKKKRSDLHKMELETLQVGGEVFGGYVGCWSAGVGSSARA